MARPNFLIRNAKPEEFESVGKLMIQVYSELDGFPKQSEQPDYYKMLANAGELTNKPETELLVAVSSDNKIAGCVVYFGDMKYYGSGGIATRELNASGFRLLAVDPLARGHGIGKLLTDECIKKATEKKQSQVIIHTTLAMQTAWKMYEKIGFKRSADLDFRQGELQVFGFRLFLMQPELKISRQKKLIGKRMRMTFSDNKTRTLWKNFMQQRREIVNNIGTELYSIQIYSQTFFNKFNPEEEFEKWAATEVEDFSIVPEGFQTLTLEAGLYAVFSYKGAAKDAAGTFRYIFESWLPDSDYTLDYRPHFEILGEKYINDSPDSEEELWIPVKPK
jgi:predicted transcriptional regulator YdeE/ribosomal protein S18 acetylase RimI-like enzyme